MRLQKSEERAGSGNGKTKTTTKDDSPPPSVSSASRIPHAEPGETQHANTIVPQALVDAPTDAAVPRHSAAFNDLTLTPIVLSQLPNAAGTGALRKRWDAEKIDDKWNNSTWAQSRAKATRRRELSDFERFKVLRARKSQRSEIRRSLAKVQKTAKA